MAVPLAHVLLFPFPAAGHISAAAALAQKLVHSGAFFVTFACAHHRLFDPRAGSRLAHLTHPNIRVVDLEDHLSSSENSQIDDGVDSLFQMGDIVKRLQAPLERTMVELMASPSPPLCIITDTLSFIPEVAQKFEIPWYAFFPMAARELAFQLYVPHLHTQARLLLDPKGSEPEGESTLSVGHGSDQNLLHIPGLPPWNVRECNTFFLDTKWQQRFFETCRTRHEAEGFIVNTFDELETDAMAALLNPLVNPNRLPVYALGPLISFQSSDSVSAPSSSPDKHEDSDQYCLRWLSRQPSSSVIYISFGSIVIPSVDQIRELACGLEATKASFIWVLRPPRSTPGADDDDQISKGAGLEAERVLPEGFQGRTGERGIVVCSWVPQQRILAHPSTAGFFTHCGWNSSMESIYFGVPAIALPDFFDQTTNCKILVEELGMGVEARRGEKGVVGREEVERVIGLLMDGEEGGRMREKAKEWSEAAQKAAGCCPLGGPAHSSYSSSSRNLEAFLKDLCTLQKAQQSSINGICKGHLHIKTSPR